MMDYVRLAMVYFKKAQKGGPGRQRLMNLIMFAQYAGAAQALKQRGSDRLYKMMDAQIDRLLDDILERWGL